MKLLIIEDDPEIQEIISIGFQMSWPGVKVVSSLRGKKGIELSENEKPDIIILDLGLPDISGFEVLKEIRFLSSIPIIILTVRGDEQDKIRGLELGADDYMVKPFSPAELLARVRAVLRRCHMPEEETGELLAYGDLTFDTSSREVMRGGNPVKLTPTEYNLLYLLVKNEGKVLTHEVLLDKVWGEEYVDAQDYLKVYIKKLRQKLEPDPQNPRFILTHRGIGYKFVSPS